MTTPGRLELGKDGRVTGPASITWNDPWPCVNGTPGGSGKMSGVVLHTMVGNLPGTVAWFNNPQSQASAFFGVDQHGAIHQFGPVGVSWMAWAQAAGNPSWYSIETADDGHPGNPLTPAQITAVAQLTEFLSRFAGFPPQVTDSVDGRGLICHSDGGAAWGNHPDCPGHVRAAQRAEIIALAKEIRVGVIPAPPPVSPPPPVPAPPPVVELEGILVSLPGGASRKVLSRDGGKSWQ